jgi:hypothetical protein
MNKYAFLIFMTIQTTVYALPNNLTWRCNILDENNIQWSNESVFKRKAINTIYDSCKNNSRAPTSCNKNNVQCGSFLNGISTIPIWQCTALDSNAQAWQGDIAPQKDEAALNAKGKCTRQSAIPDTCYIHMLTCKNRNAAR